MDVVVVKIDDLKFAEYNPRKLSKKQRDDITRSIKEFGMVEPIVVNNNNDRKNIIIGGHQRLTVLKDLGIKEVHCVYVDLTLDREKELNIRLNKNTGEFDFDILLSEFDTDDLIKWGFDDIDFDIDIVPPEDTVGDDEYSSDIDLGVTTIGDIYELGDHLLLCGDAGSIDDAKKVVGDDLCAMMFTDPPYGVSYKGKTKDALEIQNDDLDEADLLDKVLGWFSVADLVLREGAYVLATVPAGPLHIIFASDWKTRGWLRQIMVWNKDSFVLGHSEYHYKHEPILFGWKPGVRIKNKDRTKSTVWDFDRPKRSEDHPTMKPVEMWVYGINNHSKKGDLIFEPFGGSGTSLIACEKTGRRSRIIEIDPKYCDVIVKRYVDFCKKNNKEVSIKRNGELCLDFQ